MSKKILYLHGRGSIPGGKKPRLFESLGYEVLNPHLPDSSFEESVKIAQKCIDEFSPDVIVGSSRGGAVAMSVDRKKSEVVLVCPAWKTFNVKPSDLTGTRILHSSTDELVPIEDSNILEEQYNASLVTCGTSHRMIDNEALNTLKGEVRGVLSL